jgi:RHS repeat-associated protein
VLQVTGDCDTLGDTLKAWQFTYDGDGAKVKQEYTDSYGTLTTYYYGGGSYEVQSDGSTEITRQYYALAGVSAGMREGDTFSWFLTDHLGSVVGVTDADATLISQTRYTPFGEIRTDVGTINQTDYGYTFQRNVDGMGLMDYKARYYSPLLGRFTQPDSIVPNPYEPQNWNRYSYVNGNPITHDDPSGHCIEDACVIEVISVTIIELVIVSVALVETVQFLNNNRAANSPSVSFTNAFGQITRTQNEALFSFITLTSLLINTKITEFINSLSFDKAVKSSSLTLMKGEYIPDFLRGQSERNAYHEALELYKKKMVSLQMSMFHMIF